LLEETKQDLRSASSAMLQDVLSAHMMELVPLVRMVIKIVTLIAQRIQKLLFTTTLVLDDVFLSAIPKPSLRHLSLSQDTLLLTAEHAMTTA